MYIQLSKAVFLLNIKYYFALNLNHLISPECLFKNLVFNNAVVRVSLLAFGNDNGESKHSLYKRLYSFLALLFTLMTFWL